MRPSLRVIGSGATSSNGCSERIPISHQRRLLAFLLQLVVALSPRD
jgi:hypothetical protein